MHDVVTGTRSAKEARQYYAKEFADYRRKKPTPYMEKLRFEPGRDTADPDEPLCPTRTSRQASTEDRTGEQSST